MKSEGETAKAKLVVGDPTYFREKASVRAVSSLPRLAPNRSCRRAMLYVRATVAPCVHTLPTGAHPADPAMPPAPNCVQVRKTARVVRAMCVLSHPIPSTNDSSSVQMILPQKQLNRRHGARAAALCCRCCCCAGGVLECREQPGEACLNGYAAPSLVWSRSNTVSFSPPSLAPPSNSQLTADIYVFCCSTSHNVAPRDKWLAFVSTTVETSDPQSELAPGLQLLGKIDEKFVEVRGAGWQTKFRNSAGLQGVHHAGAGRQRSEDGRGCP